MTAFDPRPQGYTLEDFQLTRFRYLPSPIRTQLTRFRVGVLLELVAELGSFPDEKRKPAA